ncbi:MAG TPA: Ni/Fe hydrogenase subunit alpha [Firmicutes bacterium]|nr:Ni/Fe hydrogenase subunit alpha [Bacillota bacterium]
MSMGMSSETGVRIETGAGTGARQVTVDYLARVEGEGKLAISIQGRKLESLVLDIFEPPRFFQGFLVGRRYNEVHEIVSRICGICPVSHQITALQAIESALGVAVSEETRLLRRLLAVAQTFQSHVLHVYMLALPDYLGFPSVLEMAREESLRPAVERALRLKKLANNLTALVGGRAVHPVTAVVGGFTAVPGRAEVAQALARLEQVEDDIWKTLRLVAGLQLPRVERADAEQVALVHPQEYPVNEGELHSTRGAAATAATYRTVIEERQVPHSFALYSMVRGRGPFLVGPLARVNLNFAHLTPEVRQAAEELGWEFPDENPFASIRARALEIYYCWQECIRLLRWYQQRLGELPAGVTTMRERVRPRPVNVRAGQGAALTEAPRGLLYHSYRLGRDGRVEEADIVSPTAHNVANIQRDLEVFVADLLEKDEELTDEEIALKSEMLVRSYDPCISCSVHFLDVKVERH